MKPALIAATLLFTLAAAMPARADVRTGVAGLQNAYIVPYTTESCVGCVTTFNHTVELADNTTTISATAIADYGVLKVAASATGSGNWAEARVNAEARFFDHFTIDAPGLTGQRGVFTAQFIVPYSLTVENTRWAGANLNAGIVIDPYNGVSESYYFQARDGADLPPFVGAQHNGYDVPLSAVMVLEVPFFYGYSIAIQGQMTIDTSGQLGSNGGSFAATVDASHSLYWQGITRVTDGAGHLVTGFNVTSDSGTDWSRNFAPVPEPGTWALMVAGLGMLGLKGGRRRVGA